MARLLEGKWREDASECLSQLLDDVVYKQMESDTNARLETGGDKARHLRPVKYYFVEWFVKGCETDDDDSDTGSDLTQLSGPPVTSVTPRLPPAHPTKNRGTERCQK